MSNQADRVIELNTLYKNKNNKQSNTPILACVSGKGGTGKTFLSLNIAYALARRNKKVLVIDCDTNLSNINIMLNIASEKNLSDFFDESILLSDLIYKHEENLHLIFGSSGNTNYTKLNENNVTKLFDNICSISDEYDIILIDCASGIGEDVISILRNSTYSLIVSNPEPTAVMDAYVVIKMMKYNNIEIPKMVTINRTLSIQSGKIAFGNLEKASQHFLNEELILAGILEYSEEVVQAILSQQLFLFKHQNSRISSQIISLSNNISKFVQMANSSPK